MSGTAAFFDLPADGRMLDWPHLWHDGDGDADRPVLLMLHGTGGDETEIARLAGLLDPGAAVLAPRGRVSENGMNRWFRRLAEGVFDVDDVVFRVQELVAFLATATEHYGLGGRPVIAVGLSNGANIALAAALLHPVSVSRVVAFSGMFPLDDRALQTDLSRSRVVLLNGETDTMAPTASVDRLAAVLRERGADVTLRRRPGGHGIAQQDLDAAREWIRGA